MKYTIIANESCNDNVFVLELEVFDKSINIFEAIKKACEEYVKTEEGYRTYLFNCESFNWGDFATYVPNQICEKYGFRQIDCNHADSLVDLNEQIAEPYFIVNGIDWDIDECEEDDFEELSLPESIDIPFNELLHDGEELRDFSLEDLKDRIADYISDNFCVYGFSID